VADPGNVTDSSFRSTYASISAHDDIQEDKSVGVFEAVFSGAMNEVCVFRYPEIKRRNFENETGKS
jgi:hypothetical protein